MAMNPRDAEKAKGCIDSVISFTTTKLLPHVPEMTIRFTHSVGSDTFAVCVVERPSPFFCYIHSFPICCPISSKSVRSTSIFEGLYLVGWQSNISFTRQELSRFSAW